MHRRLLAAALGLGALAPANAPAQQAERLAFGRGTVIVMVDDSTGLDLWAARRPRPGERRSPDFVGWFDPDRVLGWLPDARTVLSASAPESLAVESTALEATDGGFLTLVRVSAAADTAHPILLAFGHRSERSRWAIPVEAAGAESLLAAVERGASHGRLGPPTDLGYANPTNRAATPDRDPVSGSPTFPQALAAGGIGGEVWAMFDIGPDGRLLPGTLKVLWSDRPELADAVRAALTPYRYTRRDDGRPPRLRIYQRFRFTVR